ncbi:MAG TPA: alkaline phosphatase family protein [Solirubrobacteraceae bacterium]|nr:alkaline phosphatase family protein [Solirubrobacteraceae bacterium]
MRQAGMTRVARTLAATVALAGGAGSVGVPGAGADTLPPVRHVFIIVLENKGYAETFLAGQSSAPYLTQTLPSMGALVPGYYGIGHSSADNYLAMVSGQPPTPASKNDCPDPLATVAPDAQQPYNIAKSDGCVYPPNFPTVADQLVAKNLKWKGYMEGIPGPCSLAHDAPGNYARKHNPFVFFLSLRNSGQCAANDVALPGLATDLQSIRTTPNLVYVTPNECNDGHTNCTVTNPGGGSLPVDPRDTPPELVQADAFLKQWVPKILASPAYKQDGLLIVTFDESDADATACCNEQPGPADPNPGGIGGSPSHETPGPGGGQTGTVVLSPYIAPGSVSNAQYNHYSLLRSIEDLFGLSHLGFAAQTGLTPFGTDIYTAAPQAGGTGGGGSPGGGPGAGGSPGGGGGTGHTPLATQPIAGGNVLVPPSSTCVTRRRLSLRVARRRGVHVGSVDVYVNHRLLVTVKGPRLRVPINLTGLPGGTFTVGVVVHGRRHGHRVTLRDHRSYHTCQAARRGSPPPGR